MKLWDVNLQAEVKKNMGHIMHDIVKPNRMSMKEFVIEQLMEL
jgi:hypothetical protein